MTTIEQTTESVLTSVGLAGHEAYIGPVLFGTALCFGVVQILKYYRNSRNCLPFDAFSVRIIAFAVASAGTVIGGFLLQVPNLSILAFYALLTGFMAPTIVMAVKRIWRKRYPKPSSGEPDPEETGMFTLFDKENE